MNIKQTAKGTALGAFIVISMLGFSSEILAESGLFDEPESEGVSFIPGESSCDALRFITSRAALERLIEDTLDAGIVTHTFCEPGEDSCESFNEALFGLAKLRVGPDGYFCQLVDKRRVARSH